MGLMRGNYAAVSGRRKLDNSSHNRRPEPAIYCCRQVRRLPVGGVIAVVAGYTECVTRGCGARRAVTFRRARTLKIYASKKERLLLYFEFVGDLQVATGFRG